MANGNGSTRLTDGSLDFSAGVDSGRVPTIASEALPNGLKRNQLAFGNNITVRGGGIRQRTGFKPLVQSAAWSGLFQCAYLYGPLSDLPYIVMSVGGRIYRVNIGTHNSVVDLSAAFGLTNPATEPLGFMVQGEQFLVIQAGDYITLPLFWDGTTLRRSAGFLGVGNPGNELPAAGPMDYYMGRLWYAQGRQYIAGDIVGSKTSGTAPYNYRDSILKNTENPLSLAGDAFIVPTNAGNIRMLKHTAELDTTLGQGRLLIGTTQAIYRLNVPVTRADWIAATDANQPLQTVAQIRFGPVGDRGAVVVNGDLFYQTLEPAIRSLTYAIRYFQQWGNTPISRNENRVLAFNDRALLRYSSGIAFDNRLLQTALPYQTASGVCHKGIVPLDFDVISSLEEKLPPAWEGLNEGLQFMQLLEGDFGGLQRAFSVVVGELSGEIEVWELTSTDRFDGEVNNDGRRVNWSIETPAYTWGNPMALKKLDGMELWIDDLVGTVLFRVEFKVDQDPCWYPWVSWRECSAKDCREDDRAVSCPDIDYPIQAYCPGFRATMSLPTPPLQCQQQSGRPNTEGFQFAVRITVKGWARIRGILLYAIPRQLAPFHNIVC